MSRYHTHNSFLPHIIYRIYYILNLRWFSASLINRSFPFCTSLIVLWVGCFVHCHARCYWAVKWDQAFKCFTNHFELVKIIIICSVFSSSICIQFPSTLWICVCVCKLNGKEPSLTINMLLASTICANEEESTAVYLFIHICILCALYIAMNLDNNSDMK